MIDDICADPAWDAEAGISPPGARSVMTADQLQAALDARPFRPFTIYPVANSCAFITHPRNVWCSQTGNLVVIELLVNEIIITSVDRIKWFSYPEDDRP